MEGPVQIVGAGPAGAAAALSCLAAGRPVVLFEERRTVRNKVCGEFLCAEAVELLEQLGCASELNDRKPARIDEAAIWLGKHGRKFRLPRPGWGLSRLALDEILLRRAQASGAEVRQERAQPRPGCVWATGRGAQLRRGASRTQMGHKRFFGFKAHFAGQAGRAVELFFGSRFYVGIAPIEGGRINVCGLAAEEVLKGIGFDYDRLVQGWGPLRERLQGLERIGSWTSSGPLPLGRGLRTHPELLLAGDALAFADPFTGSGLYNALLTGQMAGLASAQGWSPTDYYRQCEQRLGRALAAGSWLRWASDIPLVGVLVSYLPWQVLYRRTRS